MSFLSFQVLQRTSISNHVCLSVSQSVDRSIGWLVGWLVGRVVVWSVGKAMVSGAARRIYCAVLGCLALFFFSPPHTSNILNFLFFHHCFLQFCNSAVDFDCVCCFKPRELQDDH